jgi:hypothetical protein
LSVELDLLRVVVTADVEFAAPLLPDEPVLDEEGLLNPKIKTYFSCHVGKSVGNDWKMHRAMKKLGLFDHLIVVSRSR